MIARLACLRCGRQVDVEVGRAFVEVRVLVHAKGCALSRLRRTEVVRVGDSDADFCVVLPFDTVTQERAR